MRQLPTTRERHFDDTAVRQVEVLFDAILPGSDTAPGAKQARAADFLDHLLSVDAFYEVAGWRRLYAAGLPGLDATASRRFGRPLADIDTQEATALLADLAAGTLADLPAEVNQKALFTALRGHCIEGCFSDQRWGGNAAGVMWRWLGYPVADGGP